MRHIGEWSVKVAQLHLAWTERHTPPVEGPRLAWPAPLCEALSTYGAHLSRRLDAEAAEARAKAQRHTGHTSR